MIRTRNTMCPACGREKPEMRRFCAECSELVRAINNRGEWWQVAPNGEQLPEQFTKHGQCGQCGSWMTCPEDEAESHDDEGRPVRTAVLELVTGPVPYYRCEGCGAKFPVRWHLAGECLD